MRAAVFVLDGAVEAGGEGDGARSLCPHTQQDQQGAPSTECVGWLCARGLRLSYTFSEHPPDAALAGGSAPSISVNSVGRVSVIANEGCGWLWWWPPPVEWSHPKDRRVKGFGWASSSWRCTCAASAAREGVRPPRRGCAPVAHIDGAAQMTCVPRQGCKAQGVAVRCVRRWCGGGEAHDLAPGEGSVQLGTAHPVHHVHVGGHLWSTDGARAQRCRVEVHGVGSAHSPHALVRRVGGRLVTSPAAPPDANHSVSSTRVLSACGSGASSGQPAAAASTGVASSSRGSSRVALIADAAGTRAVTQSCRGACMHAKGAHGPQSLEPCR